jgi:type I restriction enzyme S subunit
MSPEFKRILESKRAFRRKLAEKPVAEKLRIVEDLAERTLATRKDTSAPLPNEPWPVPHQWHWSKMGDVATIIGGSTPRTEREEYFGGDVPWITPADLSKYNEKTISHGARNITQAGLENSGARLLPAGAVLFSSRAPIGYVAIAANPIATNQGFKSFILRDELLPDFVYYYLKRAKELAVALASGTTFLEISGKNAARLPIPVAPLPEQRRIVAEIEKQFTRLEAGVAALRRVQANLHRYRAAVLKAACEGRLVPTEAERRKKFETGEQLLQRILKQRREKWSGKGKYKEPAAPDITGLPKLPDGWCWATLDQVSSRVSVGHVGPTSEFYCDEQTGIIFVRSQNVRPGRLSYEGMNYITCGFHNKLKKSRLQPGDVLIVRVGANRGDVCVVPPDIGEMNCANIVFARPLAGISTYIDLYLNSRTGRESLLGLTTGSAQGVLNTTSVAEALIPLSPLAEQERIVAEVERRLSVVEELSALVESNLKRAGRLRQAVLQEAFEGKLVANEVN